MEGCPVLQRLFKSPKEGKEQIATKVFTGELGSGTALTLRLSKNRKVYSSFRSLKTLMEHRIWNAFYMGIVKTASNGYPLKYMQGWYQRGRESVPSLERGNHLVVQSTYCCRVRSISNWLE